MGLSTTYTKTETDFLIQQLEKKTTSGYKGDLIKTDAAPTQIGFYGLLETGIYTNLGGINAQSGKLNFASFDGTTWSKVEVEIPTNIEKVFNKLDDEKGATMKATADFADVRYLNKADYIGPEFQNILPVPSTSTNGQSLILNAPSLHSGVITRMRVLTSYTGIHKFQVVKKITNNNPNPDTFRGGDKFTINATAAGNNIYDVIGELPSIEKGDYVAWIFEAGDTVQPRFGGADNIPAYGRWGGGKVGYFDTETTMSFSAIAGVAFAFEVDYNELILKSDLKPIEDKIAPLQGGIQIISNNLFDKSKAIQGSYVVGTTGNVSANSSYSYIKYIACKPSTNYIQSNQQQIAFFDANKVYISGITKAVGGKFTTPPNCAFHSVNVENTNLDGFILNEGSVLKPYDAYSEYYILDNKIKAENIIGGGGSSSETVEVVRVTAVRNANNYNSIRELMSSITDASPTKQYEIFIPDGEWFEFDLQGKKYVKLVGQSRDKTILYCDGNSTNPLHVAPSDFSYPAEAGKQIANIDLIYKHVFFAKNDIHAENITIKQIAGKYCTHLDNINYKSVYFKNVRLISIDNSYPVGIGIWAGQSIVFEDFVIDYLETTPTTLRKLGFFIHNSINQSKGTYFKAENGVFHGCGYGTISELGSTQTDDWNFINCSTDSIGEFFYMVDVSIAGTYPNPRNVPYNIRLNTYGTKVDLVLDRPATNFPSPYNTGTQRPDFYKYMVSDYVQEVMPIAGSGIVKGDIIAIDDSSLPTFQRFVAKKLNSATDIKLGVALENAVDGQKLRYTPLDKYALTFVNGVVNPNYANYRMKLNASYQLESDATLTPQNVIGLALEIKGAGLGLHYVKVN